MARLQLTVLSLRYSSWSMRPWLALTHTGAAFETATVELPHMQRQGDAHEDSAGLTHIASEDLAARRQQGSIAGLFPVLKVGDVQIHESLAICEYLAETYPKAALWPQQALDRARARAICSEMCTGFSNLRGELSCHLFGRVPGYVPSAAAEADIARVFEIWNEALSRSGGPFLFGSFSIADAMFFPVLARFRTYDVTLPAGLQSYAQALWTQPSVQQLVAVARTAPRIPIYDDYLLGLGGDPDGWLASGADQ